MLTILNELVAALNDDANSATTLQNQIALKQNKVEHVSDTEIGYVNGVPQPTRQQRNARQTNMVHTLPDADSTASWVKIGTLTTSQGGYATTMIISSSDGFMELESNNNQWN